MKIYPEKKRTPTWLLILVIIIVGGFLSFWLTWLMMPARKVIYERVVVDTVYVQSSEWAKLLDAIVEVESEGNPDAFNERTNAAGILQITPIYVAEVNRLLGEERYTLEDRYDIQKSVEMYCVYQAHKNPQKDIERAIWLHNPTASVNYKNKILRQL